MTTGPAPYDYAWKTPGWTVQNPAYTTSPDGYADPGLPSDISKVRVYGSFMEWDSGRNLEGILQLRVNKVLRYVPTNTQVMPGVKRIRFRPTGFSLYLPATDDPQLAPTGWSYQARLTVHGTVEEFGFVLLSADEEVNINELMPADFWD